MTFACALTVAFRLRDRDGAIHVAVAPNDDPARWGCDLLDPVLPSDAALGYPVCTATVDYPGEGYAAAFGWLQLVRSTDGEDGPNVFSLDPTTIYRDVATPYAWFGVKPLLFDAPFRASREAMAWRAHSFLCFSSDGVMSREVRALAGFSWGFDVVDAELRLVSPEALAATTWGQHLGHLRERFPDWRFVEGFRDR